MRHKAAEATCNINQAFGQGTINECTAQHWFKRFHNGDSSLEDEGRGCPTAIDNQLRAITEGNPCKITQGVAEKLTADHSTAVRHLHQTGKSKKA
jgi:hypothetical protein